MTRGGVVAVVDGVLAAEEAVASDQVRLPLADPGVSHGDGAFESVGVWGGRPFRLAEHLDRLDATLRWLALPPLDRAAAEADVAMALTRWRPGLQIGGGALRIRVDAGGRRVVTIGPLPDRPPPRVLLPQPAPWVQPGAAPGKTLSYAPNLAATRRARAAGGDDALLLSVRGGLILETPTAAVLLVRGGRLLAPDPALGIVDSVSRRALLEVAAAEGIAVEAGGLPLDLVRTADEVLVVSALRRPSAVARVGDVDLPPTAPTTDRLATALDHLRRC